MNKITSGKANYIFTKLIKNHENFRKYCAEKIYENKVDKAGRTKGNLYPSKRTIERWRIGERAISPSYRKLITSFLKEKCKLSNSYLHENDLHDSVPVDKFMEKIGVDLDRLLSVEYILEVGFAANSPIPYFYYNDRKRANRLLGKYKGKWLLYKTQLFEKKEYVQRCVLDIGRVERPNSSNNEFVVACVLQVPSIDNQREPFTYYGAITNKKANALYWIFSEERSENEDCLFLITNEFGSGSNEKAKGHVITISGGERNDPIQSKVSIERAKGQDIGPKRLEK